MLVAKTYQNWEIVSAISFENGKEYVHVKNPKNGRDKKVRVYSNKEYEKMYGETKEKLPSAQHALGFDNGYITIFKGDQKEEENEDFFRNSNARWARWWGWYIVSTESIPEKLPFGIEPITLNWADVSRDGRLKTDTEVAAIVDKLLYDESTAEFIGAIGDRLDLVLTVDKAIEVEGYYGKSTMHIMHDCLGNVFIWSTGSKTLTVGNTYTMRGTIKQHSIYQGTPQNFLTRCTIKTK